MRIGRGGGRLALLVGREKRPSGPVIQFLFPVDQIRKLGFSPLLPAPRSRTTPRPHPPRHTLSLSLSPACLCYITCRRIRARAIHQGRGRILVSSRVDFSSRVWPEMRSKTKCRISRIGSYAIASSVGDHHSQPCITCTTFNILAPIYKRLNQKVRDFTCRFCSPTEPIDFKFTCLFGFEFFFPFLVKTCLSYFSFVGMMQDPSCRESDYRAYWLTRNQKILDWLLYERSSIICLQVYFLY